MKTKQSSAQSKRAQRRAPIYRGDFEGAISFVRQKMKGGERISIPLGVLTEWQDQLESALILLQEIDASIHRGGGLDIRSALDGAHALVDRVSDDIRDWEEPTDDRAPAGKP